MPISVGCNGHSEEENEEGNEMDRFFVMNIFLSFGGKQRSKTHKHDGHHVNKTRGKQLCATLDKNKKRKQDGYIK